LNDIADKSKRMEKGRLSMGGHSIRSRMCRAMEKRLPDRRQIQIVAWLIDTRIGTDYASLGPIGESHISRKCLLYFECSRGL
jgi:hypothetical protein